MYSGEGREGESILGQELLRPYLSKHQIHMCFCDGGAGHDNEVQLETGKTIVTNGKKGEDKEGYLIPENSTSHQYDTRPGRKRYGEQVKVESRVEDIK